MAKWIDVLNVRGKHQKRKEHPFDANILDIDTFSACVYESLTDELTVNLWLYKIFNSSSMLCVTLCVTHMIHKSHKRYSEDF